MIFKIMKLVVRNVFRSKTRTFVTIFGCMIGAAIISFFMTADHSLTDVMYQVSGDANLIMTQKDRF